MKHPGFTLSIIKDSNTAIAHTEADLSNIREGSLIKFGTDDVFYTIARAEYKHYIKDFEVVSRNQIKINGDIGDSLLLGDNVYLTHKEYKLSNVIKIKSAGAKYKIGDIVTLFGGTLSISLSDNHPNPAKLKVVSVNGDGGISDLEIIGSGKYLESPSGRTDGGSGTGAEVECDFSIYDDRANLDAVISNINNRTVDCTLTLGYNLPNGLKEGKLSCEKWCLHLTSNYTGDTKLNSDYTILGNLTPYLSIPLLVKNSPNNEFIINEALKRIDLEINNLKNLFLQKQP